MHCNGRNFAGSFDFESSAPNFAVAAAVACVLKNKSYVCDIRWAMVILLSLDNPFSECQYLDRFRTTFPASLSSQDAWSAVIRNHSVAGLPGRGIPPSYLRAADPLSGYTVCHRESGRFVRPAPCLERKTIAYVALVRKIVGSKVIQRKTSSFGAETNMCWKDKSALS